MATTRPICSLGLTQSSQVHEGALAVELVGTLVVAARSRVGDGCFACRMRAVGVENSSPAVARASPSPQSQSVLEEFPHIRLSSYKPCRVRFVYDTGRTTVRSQGVEQFYSIGQLAAQAGVNVETIRY